MQALAERTVADLVVILQKQHKGTGGQMPAGLAASGTVARGLALVDKPFAQAAGQLGGGVVGKIGVVGVGLAGQQHMQGVMPVIVPLRIEALLQQAGLIEFVFQDQPHMARRVHLLTHPLGQLF